MINTSKLRGKIAEEGFSQRELARKMGIHEATFYRKMEKGIFNNDEMEKLIHILKIDNPLDIFFTNRGT